MLPVIIIPRYLPHPGTRVSQQDSGEKLSRLGSPEPKNGSATGDWELWTCCSPSVGLDASRRSQGGSGDSSG